MCSNCYEKYGSPSLVTPRVMLAFRRLHAMSEFLMNHSSPIDPLINWDVKDDDVERAVNKSAPPWCRKQNPEIHGSSSWDDLDDDTRGYLHVIACDFKQMSFHERVITLALYENIIEPPRGVL